MAATKKNLEIQDQKSALRKQLSDLTGEAKLLCNRVPKAVLTGGARLAAEWRDVAEETHFAPVELPFRMTAAEILARIDKINHRIAFLRYPSVSQNKQPRMNKSC